MDINKHNIEYLEINSQDKTIFVFVNHKTAILCWAKIKELFGQDLDVITFDSHRDFRDGAIDTEGPLIEKGYLGSKYHTHLKQHFSNCEEFLDWNCLNNKQNVKLISIDKKFLFPLNDNFIDVAFMKNIVNNVYWYYLNLHGNSESGKCEDFNDIDHFFIKHSVKSLKRPLKPFILDIDIDFFVKDPGSDSSLISMNMIKKYLKLQKNLFLNGLCKGLTIALEPDCCGGEDNCLKILNELCQEFNLDLLLKSKELIRRAK